ncbi:MAG TPA: monovalent cation/H+ antiporter subunit D family protein [Woeseiaceae bacterium]|nr:monovalent cation/H+ antiporter subunit D family protein [Woeseiaceae bacterium]
MTLLAAHLPVLQVVVPLLTAPLVVLLRRHDLAWAAATTASACAFAIAVELVRQVGSNGALSYELGGWPPPYGIELSVDAFSALLLLVVSGASTVGLLICRTSFGFEVAAERRHLFHSAWLLALAGLAGILVAGDAFNIFVFMEISSLATYILIAGGSDRQALPAVFKYLIMGTIGATFYLIGVGLIYMMTGTLNLADMANRIGEVADLKPLLVAGGFITVGLALKAAVFPLHTWLPNAYTYAPHAVTVFIAACSTKVALYVLLRFDFFVFQGNLPGHVSQFTTFVLPVAVIAILVASSMALFEKNLKRLLAFSSIAQVGYMLLGAGFVSVTGLTAGIVHMFNHALAKGALFLAAACLAAGGTSLTVSGLSGAASRMPWTMAAFVGAGLSLIGIPGTAGFVGKWYLVRAALEAGALGALLIVPVLAGSLIAVLYVWRVVEAAYFEPAGDPARREAPRPMLVLLWLLLGLNVWFGVQPMLPLGLAGEAAYSLLAPRE